MNEYKNNDSIPHNMTLFTTGAISATLFLLVLSLIFIPFGNSTNTASASSSFFNTDFIRKAQGTITSYVKFAQTCNGGIIQLVQYDDNTSAFVELCPMTQEEQQEFGHVPCPQMTTEEFRTIGMITVGKTNYTWCDDSVLDFTYLSEVYNLHVEDGIYKDNDGYVACYSRTNELYDVVETPLGTGRIYDIGADWFTIGVFLSVK